MSDDDKFHGCVGLVVIICLVFGFPLYMLIGSNIHYSDGFRDGILQKASHKGILFKTYEGELALEGFKFKEGGKSGNVFEFTVDEPSIIVELDKHPGKKVRLHYKQTLSRLPWQGDTSTRIVRVETLD